jgi:beta-N-acetylhexosaminidase
VFRRLVHASSKPAVQSPPLLLWRAGVATVMSAHVVYDGLDAGVPATLSHTVMTRLLRGVLGFTGVAFSDDLQMKALSARMSVEDAAVAAITAGCDGLLVCTDPDAQERAREALACEAAKDASFEARLREAHGRMLVLRRRIRP